MYLMYVCIQSSTRRQKSTTEAVMQDASAADATNQVERDKRSSNSSNEIATTTESTKKNATAASPNLSVLEQPIPRTPKSRKKKANSSYLSLFMQPSPDKRKRKEASEIGYVTTNSGKQLLMPVGGAGTPHKKIARRDSETEKINRGEYSMLKH